MTRPPSVSRLLTSFFSVQISPTLNRANLAIFSIAARQEPSMWMVAPMGMTTSLISRGMPVWFAASRFEGMVATLLPVARAVSDGGMMFFQNVRTPIPWAAR